MKFNPLIADLALPPIPAVQEWGTTYEGQYGPLIDLSQAVPGYPPHADMLGWLAEAGGSAEFTGYGPIEGETMVRKVFARHQSQLYGATLDASNIHMTAGCNQAFVTAAMAVARAGESVLLTNPCYFNHETTLNMLGIGVRYIDCPSEGGFLPRPERVADAIGDDVRALALVSPNNPTGAIYPPALLMDLFALCRDRGIWLILDETYRDFLPHGEDAPHAILSQPGWESSFISLYSFSKSFCIPGHRLGAVTASRAFIQNVAKIMDNLQICAPRPVQFAVARGMSALAGWREENRRKILERGDVLRQAMATASGWKLDALGAYFAFVRHPFTDKRSTTVAEALARQVGILAIPGEFFGAGQENHIRIAFANADAAGLRQFADRLSHLRL